MIAIIAVIIILTVVMVVYSNKDSAVGGENAVVFNTKIGEISVQDAFEAREGEYTIIRSSTKFDILFYPKDQSFLITISSTPIDNVKKEAEKTFIEALNITEEQACELPVVIRVPYRIDPAYAGVDYKLSFCK